MRERLQVFYCKHNPSHLCAEKIDQILQAYANGPELIFPDLDAKYGTSYSRPEEREAKAAQLRRQRG